MLNKRKANWQAIEQQCKPSRDDVNDPYAFYDLPKSLQVNLVTWCLRYHRQENINHSYTSYTLKHIFSDFTKKYVNNGQFKGAMLIAGFRVHDLESLNWKFNISKSEIRKDLEILKQDKSIIDETRRKIYELSKPENKEIREQLEAETKRIDSIYRQGYNDCLKKYGISEVSNG
ncbi:hypothetical protein [Facklamia sp. P9177]|uniref:hypothetical protein n=1 Tax=Facklamia sp. P9177 TaxID=3421945 RepID=UPI003D1667D4